MARIERRDLNGLLNWLAPAVILVLAAALRIYGLRWGLPNDLHAYSYHPDEFLTVGASARVAGLVDGHRTINPHFYNYPSLYLYLSALSMMVGGGYGLLSGPQSPYLAARIITVIMAVGSVAAIYWAGRVMFGNLAGLIAAFLLAIAPIHVQHSHFATVDVPSTLFIALCLGFSGLIFRRGSWRDYILAGVMAGLAGGTKYNAALVTLAPIAAHFLRTTAFSWKLSKDLKAWSIPVCAIVAFIISTPGAVLNYDQFRAGFDSEKLHAMTGHGLVFAGTGNGFAYTFTSSLINALGPALAVLFIVAVIWGVWKRDWRIVALLAFALPYYALISISQVRFARYAMPLIPVAVVMIGWLANRCYDGLRERRQIFGSATLVLLSAAAIVSTVWYTSMLVAQFGQRDPRDEAARWIFTNVPKGSSVGIVDYPWFYSPPLSKDFGFGTLPQRQEAAANTPYKLVVWTEKNRPGWWWRSRPEWAVVSDYEVNDAIRLRDNKAISAADRETVDATIADLDILRKNYSVRKVVKGTLPDLPHDMRYVSPTITVYELKK